ncbi:equilibrative nucleoside transporter 1-like [Ptychodera flava]|uniref:equilibrative nucleoside transporter 1-like n=1 Tax=Ptychodera flava TaxID=63121 RepID=UPI003969ECDF
MSAAETLPYQTRVVENGIHDSLEKFDEEDDDPATNLLSSSESRRGRVSMIKPFDSFRAVYLIIGFLGMGCLLPWNMFITASGYYKMKFRCVNCTTMNATEFQETFENFFSVAANVSNIVMLFCNAALKHLISLNMRMYSGMVVVLIMFIVTAVLVLIPTDSWQSLFFGVTIISVVVICSLGAVFQGSLLGLAGILPSEYMQSAMSGMAFAGIFASLASILSIAASSNVMASAFGYFLSAVAMMALSIVSYTVLQKLPFFKYHYLKPIDEDLKSSTINGSISSSSTTTIEDRKTKPPFMFIFKKIWLMALNVILVFVVTIGCFPSVTSRVDAMHQNTTWEKKYFTPVACFLLFNTCDCIGRTLTSFVKWPDESGVGLTLFVLLRIAFLPLFALCNVQPRPHGTTVIFDNDAYFITFMLIFALSNGYLGTLCMIYGPKKVDDEHKETAGTMMAFFLSVGLGLGGALSFAVTESV